MGDTTGITWCDATHNEWIGCTKVSAGCDHCYPNKRHTLAEIPEDLRIRQFPSRGSK